MNTVLNNLTHLSSKGKIQPVEDLWVDISEQTGITSTSSAVREEVLRRAAWRDTNPGSGRTFSQIAANINERI